MPSPQLDIKKIKALLRVKHLYENEHKDFGACYDYLLEHGHYSPKSCRRDCSFTIEKYIDLILTIRDSFKGHK